MKKQLTGIVVSTKMDKTVSVRVERTYRHPMYQKVIHRHTKFLAHNTLPSVKEGDVVVIEETRPLSKRKSFQVIERKTK